MNNYLKHIIEKKENSRCEFKKSFNNESIESIVAFSNSTGGTVLIGVSDSGAIVGTEALVVIHHRLQHTCNSILLIGRYQDTIRTDINA